MVKREGVGVRDYTHLLVMPKFKAGDLPPDGYLQWHEWADVQRKAGIKQAQCPTCSLWRTPQELSTVEIVSVLKDRRGRELRIFGFQCAKCTTKATP